MKRYNNYINTLAIILIASLTINANAGILGDNLIMKPLPGKTGQESAIIFIVGASCSQEEYVDTLRAIQEKVDFPLWVGIPHIIGNTAIPVGLGIYISNVKSEMVSKGMQSSTKIFYGGHSLGGASISSWLSSNSGDAEGGFLFGAYVSSKIEDPAKNFPVPLLTVGAQFDGWLARITRIARSYDQMKSSSIGLAAAKYRYPVVVIPGMDHAAFLNGTTPPTVQKTDLRATISIKEAIVQMSDVVSSFITYTREGDNTRNGLDAKTTLNTHIDSITAKLMDPILDIWAQEGNPSLSSFKNSTPWVVEAQKYVAGKLVNEFEYVDEYKTFTALIGDFSHAKPTIQKNGDHVQVQSYSHSAYNWRTASQIDAADYYAAYEVGAKLKSRAALYHYLNRTMTEKEPTCQEMNKFTYQWVLNNWKGDKAVLEYFQENGQPLEFIEDSDSVSGIVWVNQGMTYTNTTTTEQVQSKFILSSVDFIVPKAAGMLYCKLMSPARILEWIMVDGLMQQEYWIPNTIGLQQNSFLQQVLLTLDKQ